MRAPLDFEFTESIGPSNRTYAVTVVPYDPGGEFSWGDGGGVLMRGGTSGGGCSCVSYDGHGVVFGCTAQCPCAGTCLAVGTYSLENASFPFSGGECRCGFDDPDPPAPPPPSEQPSFSVSFSNAAVIFEDTYQDKPGVWKPRRSTRVWVSVSATGGPYGGSFTLVTENLGKLTPVACGPMVFPPSMDLGPYGLYRASFLCEGATQSDSAGDVRMSGTFVENETGALFSSSNSLTVVRILLTPVVDPPKAGASGRHKYGVCEQVAHQQFPAAPAVTWNPVGGGYDTVGANNQSSYNFPLYACENPLRVEMGAVSYVPLLSCIEPTGIVTGTVDLCTYGLPPGKAGGIGLLQEMYVTPLTVSFSRISVEEVPCDQGSVEGYFRYATPTNLWSHTRAAGAGKWRNVDINNRIGGENNVRDEAALAEEQLPMTSDGTLTNDYSCGWIDGLTVWQVPSGWNVYDTKGEAEPFKTFGTVTQEFYIDRWGQTTVQKFGNRATRLLNGRRFLNSREIK